MGLTSLAGAFAVFFLLNPGTPRLALFWLFGLAFGFVVQRSRFCFVSALSNFFLFRDGRQLRGILGGLAVATIGFAFIMYRQLPDPSSGIPSSAYVAPFGWHLVLAGVIFGLGMMLAGGCILGTLYRLGEGAVASVIALVGIIAGMGILQHNWAWWWQGYISHLPAVWLPASLGWALALLVTLTVIAGLYWLVRSLQPKQTPPPQDSSAKILSPRVWLKSFGQATFVAGWPLALGGVVLAALNVLEYQVVDRPWGIAGEVMRWTQAVLDAIRLPAPPVASVPGT